MFHRLVEAIKHPFVDASMDVETQAEGDRCQVRSIGMRRQGLPEVEISNCPSRLVDVARNLVRQIAKHGRSTPEALAPGKIIGAKVCCKSSGRHRELSARASRH